MSHNSCTYVMREVTKKKTKRRKGKKKRKKRKVGGGKKGRKYNQEYVSKIDKCNQSPPFAPVTSKVLNRGNTLQLSP